MEFDAIFSSGAVFAAGQTIRIYGTGEGRGELTFAGIRQEVLCREGRWCARFPAMEYGGPYEVILTADGSRQVLEDVYVGEVYLFAGQSNVEFKIREGEDDPALCRTNDLLRLFTARRMEPGEAFFPEDGWVKAEKSTAKEWSALAHFTGTQLVEAKGVAVGVIACYQGASVIESWVPRGAFFQNGIHVPPEDKLPNHYTGPHSIWNPEGQLYEFMLRQVIPYGLTAVVWYQGESDTSVEEGKVYGQELTILIDEWRRAFEAPELPFVVVQLADYDTNNREGWHLVQQAQYDIQFTVPHVTTVISADVSSRDRIHPPKKYALSQRIARALQT